MLKVGTDNVVKFFNPISKFTIKRLFYRTYGTRKVFGVRTYELKELVVNISGIELTLKRVTQILKYYL